VTGSGQRQVLGDIDTLLEGGRDGLEDGNYTSGTARSVITRVSGKKKTGTSESADTGVESDPWTRKREIENNKTTHDVLTSIGGQSTGSGKKKLLRQKVRDQGKDLA